MLRDKEGGGVDADGLEEGVRGQAVRPLQRLAPAPQPPASLCARPLLRHVEAAKHHGVVLIVHLDHVVRDRLWRREAGMDG